MFENAEEECMFHGQFLCRSKDSILGETGDPKELFSVYDCEDLPLKCVVGKAEVKAKAELKVVLIIITFLILGSIFEIQRIAKFQRGNKKFGRILRL